MSDDNKVNMALDDIIKLNKKKNATEKKAGAAAGGDKKTFKRGIRAKMQNRRGGKLVGAGGKVNVGARGRFAARRGVAATNVRAAQRKGFGRAGAGNAAMNKAATKKLVQSLVKRALKRTQVRNAGAGPIAGQRKRGAVIRGRFIRTDQLARVSQRSRVIGGRAPVAAAIPTVIQQVVPSRRGRGFQRNFQRNVIQEIVRQQPVQLVTQRARPVVNRQIVVQQPQQLIRQRPSIQQIVRQNRAARLAGTGGQQVIRQIVQRRSAPRFRQQAQQQVVVVRRQPQQRQQIIQRVAPRAIQRVRTQQVVYQQQPRRFQQQRQPAFNQQRAFVQKNNRFRNALGLSGGGQMRVQEVERFEPSSSFISTTRVVRRGRGFRQ